LVSGFEMKSIGESMHFRFLPGRWSWRTLSWWFIVILMLDLGVSLYVSKHPFTGRLPDSRASLDSAISDIATVESKLTNAEVAATTLDRRKRVPDLAAQLQRSLAACKCARNAESDRLLAEIVRLGSGEVMDPQELAELAKQIAASRSALTNVKAFLAEGPR
jgi:hypothetical protein